MLHDGTSEGEMNNDNMNSIRVPAFADLKALLMAALAGAVLALMLGVTAMTAMLLAPV